MSLDSRGEAALIRRQKAARGRPLTYTRGGTTAAVVGWVGNVSVPATLSGESGARQEWENRVYFFAVADLTAFGEPAEGDRITESVNGVAEVYEVLIPAGGGEQAKQPAAQGKTIYRLHTKKVG